MTAEAGTRGWRKRKGKRKVKGGKCEEKGSTRVGRAAAVEERMVGKRSIGVPTYSRTVARKSGNLTR